MDQYFKQGQLISYTGGQELNLNARQFNHKAFVLFGTGVEIKMSFSSGDTLSGLTLQDASPVYTNSLVPAIVPLRVYKIDPTGDGKILLLN